MKNHSKLKIYPFTYTFTSEVKKKKKKNNIVNMYNFIVVQLRNVVTQNETYYAFT